MTGNVLIVLLGIWLFASYSDADLQHEYDLDYDEDNSPVHQEVSTDLDENIVQYHLMNADSEVWTVEDFDRDIKMSKVCYRNGKCMCLVNSLDESKSATPSKIREHSATNSTNTEVKMMSDVTTIAGNPVRDSSFLGTTASSLCVNTSVYWTFATFRDTTDQPINERSSGRSKRSSNCACACDQYRCVRRGTPSVSGYWDLTTCVKSCTWRNNYYGEYPYYQYSGCAHRDYIPERCGGTGKYA